MSLVFAVPEPFLSGRSERYSGWSSVLVPRDLPCKGSEWRTLGAVIVLTGTYSKLEDEAYVAQVAAIANVGESTCRRALKRLNQLDVISYNGRRGPKKPLLSLTPKTVQHVEQSKTDSHAEQSSEATPAETATLDRSASRTTTEKYLEEDNDVAVLIDDLGFSANQRARALSEDPKRVLAWITLAQREATNPAAFAWSGIDAGTWPSSKKLTTVRGSHGSTLTEIDSTETPLDRALRWASSVGQQLPDDDFQTLLSDRKGLSEAERALVAESRQ